MLQLQVNFLAVLHIRVLLIFSLVQLDMVICELSLCVAGAGQLGLGTSRPHMKSR